MFIQKLLETRTLPVLEDVKSVNMIWILTATAKDVDTSFDQRQFLNMLQTSSLSSSIPEYPPFFTAEESSLHPCSSHWLLIPHPFVPFSQVLRSQPCSTSPFSFLFLMCMQCRKVGVIRLRVCHPFLVCRKIDAVKEILHFLGKIGKWHLLTKGSAWRESYLFVMLDVLIYLIHPIR